MDFFKEISDVPGRIEIPNFKKADSIIPKFTDAKENKVLGGLYGDLKKEWQGKLSNLEIHHMPADSINGLERNKGLAIVMSALDHRKTASFGSSIESKLYRGAQEALVKANKFTQALNMDLDDIHGKFGNKYNNAIGQMMTVGKKMGYVK